MKIELKEIPVREIVKGFVDDDENGVYGYDGKLNIRPKYQREFIYKNDQRDEVIRTITKDFPLNTMYWVKSENGFELMDGQQRTLSICKYVSGLFSIDNRAFHNLTKSEQEQILDYKLMVYICEGSDKERLDWFRVINIAGEKLTDQEIRNAVYTGAWLTDAKKYFSKTGCAAYQIGSKFVKGTPIRQDFLEQVLIWAAHRDKLSCIEEYMSIHQHDPQAVDLWIYFQSVISWVNAIFPVYRKEMKGIPWGLLYNDYKDQTFDPSKLEERISVLIEDDDITKISGIYLFLLTGEEKFLSLRAFKDKDKRAVYEKQKGKCKICKQHFEIEEMEADHIIPWSQGGHTIQSNCQMLCRSCNRHKSNK